MIRTYKVKLPGPVKQIYAAVQALKSQYPGRNFTPDGHLVGSIGEVIAAEELDLKLHKANHPAHDAFDSNGNVQIKMTAGARISMYASCERLVVLRILSPEEAEIVYDGPGEPAWTQAGTVGKNGQRVISIKRLRNIALADQTGVDL